MHKEYILLNGFRKAKKGFTAGFHVPLKSTGLKAARRRTGQRGEGTSGVIPASPHNGKSQGEGGGEECKSRMLPHLCTHPRGSPCVC